MFWIGLKPGQNSSDAQICVIAETNVSSASQKTISERKILLGPNELPLLPEQRQIIHDLTLLQKASGLSPPDQEQLEQLEAKELLVLETRSDE